MAQNDSNTAAKVIFHDRRQRETKVEIKIEGRNREDFARN